MWDDRSYWCVIHVGFGDRMSRQECAICLETRTHEVCDFTCTHTFCMACSNRLRTEFHAWCPLCRASRRHPLPQTGQSIDLPAGIRPRSAYSAYVFFPSAQSMDLARFIHDRARVEEETESIEGVEEFEGASPDPSQSPNLSHPDRASRPRPPPPPAHARTPIALASLEPEVQLIVHSLLDPTLPIPIHSATPPRDWHARLPPSRM